MKYQLRVRGEIVSRHHTESGAERALRRHQQQAPKGSLLWGNLVEVDKRGRDVGIGHIVDNELEWYEVEETLGSVNK